MHFIATESKFYCTYAACNKPQGSAHYYAIDRAKSTGGKDWQPLMGQTLCLACYDRYRTRGTLERSRNKLTFSGCEKRCAYQGCDSPDKSSHFYLIDGKKRQSGGQDWTALDGHVLCAACYCQYKDRGTLERSLNKLSESAKRCTFDGCEGPEQGSHFFKIDSKKSAGGKDWTPVIGHVLCHACYARFMRSGKIERQRRAAAPLAARAEPGRPGAAAAASGGEDVGIKNAPVAKGGQQQRTQAAKAAVTPAERDQWSLLPRFRPASDASREDAAGGGVEGAPLQRGMVKSSLLLLRGVLGRSGAAKEAGGKGGAAGQGAEAAREKGVDGQRAAGDEPAGASKKPEARSMEGKGKREETNDKQERSSPKRAKGSQVLEDRGANLLDMLCHVAVQEGGLS